MRSGRGIPGYGPYREGRKLSGVVFARERGGFRSLAGSEAFGANVAINKINSLRRRSKHKRDALKDQGVSNCGFDLLPARPIDEVMKIVFARWWLHLRIAKVRDGHVSHDFVAL